MPTRTLADIATKAGVSQATISRVINDKPGVSDDTRQSVLKTMQELGIERKNAKAADSKLVTLISPDLSNPIFSSFTTHISILMAQQQILPILCVYTIMGGSETSYLAMLKERPISGAIFLSGTYDTVGTDLSIYQDLADRKIPLAFLNASAHGVDGYYVESDDAAAMTMALNHLTNLGHKKIGLLLGDKEHYPTRNKYLAAQNFFKLRGLKHDSRLTAWTTYGIGSGQMAAKKLFLHGATAIVCASDQLALGAMKAAASLGLDIPHDVSIIGYDDSTAMNYISPALTTVRQPVTIMSQALMNGLLAMQADSDLAAKRDVLLYEPELIVRASTGACRDRN